MAARANYFGITVNNGANTIKPNTVVSITVHGGGAANIYTAETGGSVSTGSVTSDANGVINIWLDPGKYDITPSGGQTRVYDTGQGSVASGDLTGNYPNPVIAAGRAAANVGALGGDLAGTLPNPTLGAGKAAANVGALGGDLAGTLPNPTLGAGKAAVNIGSLGGNLTGTLPNPSISIPTVTTLPVSPFNGQEIYYAFDTAAGIKWHFRYNSSSSSPYKWEFVGGPSTFGLASTDQVAQPTNTTPSILYYAPLFVTPFAGDWNIDMQGTFSASNSALVGLMALSGSSNALLTHLRTLDFAYTGICSANMLHMGCATGVAAGTNIVPGVTTSLATTITTYGLSMRVQPVRVG